MRSLLLLALAAMAASSVANADPNKGRQLANEANAKLMAGDRAAAAQLYDRAIAEAPEVPELWTYRANFRKQSGLTAEALADVSNAMQLIAADSSAPNDLKALTAMVRSTIYADLDRYSDALEDALATEKLMPGLPAVVLARGTALLGLGDLDAGRELIEKAGASMPQALGGLCQFAWLRGDWAGLLAAANRIEPIPGMRDGAGFWRGIAECELGHYDAAERESQSWKTQQPDGSNWRFITAYLQGTPAYPGFNPDSSLKQYREFLDQGVSHRQVLAFMARTMFLAGRYEECRDFLTTRGRRTNFPCLFWLGAAQWKLEEFAEARLTLSDARRYNPYITGWAGPIEGLNAFLKPVETEIAAERAASTDPLTLAVERETWLMSSAEIEQLVRRFQFARAAAEYEKLLPSIISPVRRKEVSARLAEVKAMSSALNKLIAAVNKKSVTLKAKVGTQELTLTKADDRAFDFTIPRGSGKFPWACLDPLDFFRFANAQASTPEEHFALGVLLWDLGEARSAQQQLGAEFKGDLKDRIATVVARKRGIEAPAGGFVLYKGTFVTPEEKENAEKGNVRFKGKWVPAADRDKLEKGMVQVDGKWLPGDEKKLTAAGLRKFKGQWMTPESYAAARSKWENAFEQETEHFKIRSNAGEGFTKDLSVVVELAYPEFRKFYDGREPRLAGGEKMTLYAFGTFEDYRRHCVERKAEDSMNAAGFAASDSNIVAGWNKSGSFQLFLQTMVHEAAHLYYFRTSSPTRLPSWHAEAMATWFEGFDGSSGQWKFDFTNPTRAAFAKEAARSDTWIPLKDLVASDAGTLINSDSRKALVFYAECWALNAFLTRTEDQTLRNAYREYRNAIATGKSADLLSYFPDLEKLEKAWREFARGQ